MTTNYQQRGVTASSFSRAPERTTLSLQPFRCGAPSGDAMQAIPYCDQQTAQALREAREHGYAPQPVRMVPGADHGPLPEAVLAWCDSLVRISAPKTPPAQPKKR